MLLAIKEPSVAFLISIAAFFAEHADSQAAIAVADKIMAVIIWTQAEQSMIFLLKKNFI